MDRGTAESKASSEMTDAPNKDDDRCNRESVSKKREGYIQWKEYFMGIAFLSAKRSKDPMTQVGACIVNKEKRIVGIGYNGMPNGCSDDDLPWVRGSKDSLKNKYWYVCHAALNAIVNKNSADVKDCTIYTTLFPCNECAKLIIQSGIKEVIYYWDKYHGRPDTVASRYLFNKAEVVYEQYKPEHAKIEIDFPLRRTKSVPDLK